MGEGMDKFEAARSLGVADADVVFVEDVEAGTLVGLRDGGTRLVRDDGHFAVDDHPATAHLRRFEAESADVGDAEPEDKPEPKPKAPAKRRIRTTTPDEL
jgi:hypothetical protein